MISVIPNFFYLTGDLGVVIYHVADTAHPIVIIVIIVIAISLGLQNLERGEQYYKVI